MGKHDNPGGRKGESTWQTSTRTGRILADRQKDAKQAAKQPKPDKVWVKGKGR